MRLAHLLTGEMVTLLLFEYVTSEGLGLDYAMVEFSVSMPPSMIEDEIYATYEVSISDY